MKCPVCGALDSRVLDSRPVEDGASIRRRRECVSCGKRFTTYEMVETALECQEEYGHPAGCTLAQIICESGMGDHLSGLATQDNNVSFNYQEFDQLEFRTDQLDNELTALVGYYIYLMLGLDCDAMAPLGGTDLLQTAQTIVNNAQSFAGKGWKAFENDRNRYAVINDLMDSGMDPFRRMQYTYYRSGLDTMNENADRARAAITEAIELLKLAKENKPLSTLPLLFTEYKSDELVGIYKGKGTSTERQTVAEILSNINPSKNSEWNQFK